jgi:hypothetical protein
VLPRSWRHWLYARGDHANAPDAAWLLQWRSRWGVGELLGASSASSDGLEQQLHPGSVVAEQLLLVAAPRARGVGSRGTAGTDRG